MTVEVFGRSDVGCVRDHNEDVFLVADLSAGRRDLVPEVRRHALGARGTLLLVCDGMGGAAAGEVASAMAAEAVHREMAAAPGWGRDRAVLARLLRRAVRTANREIHEAALADRSLRGMGTTLSAVLLSGDGAVLANIGDSRAYLIRAGAVVQLTRDQSIVSALQQAGRLSDEEARSFAHSSIILQAIGVSEDVEVSLSLADLRRGDLLLLCSDGLHGPVAEDALRDAVASATGVEAACHALIARALAAGAPDNVTAVVARVDGEGLATPRGPEDLPRFVEFDPAEDEERSITTTSRVARRLAARAGMQVDPGPAPVPPTGQHAVVTDAELARAAARSLGAQPGRRASPPPAPIGPATARIEQGARMGPAVWILAAVALAAVAALAYLGGLRW